MKALGEHDREERDARKEMLERLGRVETNQAQTQAQLSELALEQLRSARRAGAKSGATVAGVVVALASVVVAILERFVH